MANDFSYSIGGGMVSITFPGKPEADVRSMLKGHGFRWSPAGGYWWRRKVTGAGDVITALDRHYHKGRPDGACHNCKAPEGFWRNRGAGASLWCNKCAAEFAEREAREAAQRAGERAALDVDKLWEDQWSDIVGR